MVMIEGLAEWWMHKERPRQELCLVYSSNVSDNVSDVSTQCTPERKGSVCAD